MNKCACVMEGLLIWPIWAQRQGPEGSGISRLVLFIENEQAAEIH